MGGGLAEARHEQGVGGVGGVGGAGTSGDGWVRGRRRCHQQCDAVDELVEPLAFALRRRSCWNRWSRNHFCAGRGLVFRRATIPHGRSHMYTPSEEGQEEEPEEEQEEECLQHHQIYTLFIYISIIALCFHHFLFCFHLNYWSVLFVCLIVCLFVSLF